jgi:heme/copper-type cytochrome/quinol oxidase subunit 2
MNVVDLLITIVVVTILVTIVLAVITYVAYKLRLARLPEEERVGDGVPRYFIEYASAQADSPPEGHASEA